MALVAFAMVPTTPLARWINEQASALQIASGGFEDEVEEQGDIIPQSSAGVSSFNELSSAITAAAGTSVEIDVLGDFTTPTAGGKITLPSDTAVSIKSSGNHSITLSMAFMSLVNSGSSLTLGEGLTIYSRGKQVARAENGNSITLNGVIVEGGSMQGADPAIGVVGNGSRLTMESGSVTECKSSSALGVIQVQDGAEATFAGGEVTLCEDEQAAPIQVVDASSKVCGCAIDYNRGGKAGAIYCAGSTARSSLAMTDGRIRSNQGEGSGGGVYAEKSTISMTGGSFVDNQAALYGGGIALFEGAQFTFDGGTIEGNQADSGGGIYIEGTDEMSLVSGTIEDNLASGSYGTGGGIAVGRYAKGSSVGGVAMNAALITGNTAGTIGGGAWLCPTGDVDSRVSDGAAMYGNIAEHAGDDMAVVSTAGAHSPDIIQERLLGGGFFSRYIDGEVANGSDANARGDGSGKRYRADNRRVAFDCSTWNGVSSVALHNVVASDVQALATQRARLEVKDNKASNAGGGIASAGHVKIGSTETKRIAVKKKWDIPDGASTLSSVEVKLWIDGAQDETAREVESATLNAANDWTYVFEGLPVKAKANVEEVALSSPGWVTSYQKKGYNEQAIGNADASQPGTEQSSYSGLEVVTLSNARAGTLTVSNAIEGDQADSNKEFSFEITIVNPAEPFDDSVVSMQNGDSQANEPYEGRDAGHHGELLDYPYTGSKSGTLTAGSGTIGLKGGESVTLAGLPHGALFSVQEVASTAEGYQVKPVRDNTVEGHAAESGTVIGDDGVTLAYTNVRTESAGSLAVSKQVTGNLADTQKQFRFRLRLYHADGTELTGTEFGYTGSSSGVIGSGGEFTLKSGESIQVNSIPEGTRWLVKEVSEDAHGYQIKPTRATLTGEDAEQGTIESGAVSALSYTNERNESLGSLAVQKNVEEGDEGRAFQFVVRMFDSSGAELTGTEYAYSGSDSGVISSGGTLNLKHGQRVVIEGLPADATFRVTEVNADDYTATYDGCEGTIAADATVEAKVSNKAVSEPGGGESGGGESGGGESGGTGGEAGDGDTGETTAHQSPEQRDGSSDASTQGNDGAEGAHDDMDDNTPNAQNGSGSVSSAPKGPLYVKTGDALSAVIESAVACALIVGMLVATVFTRRLRRKLANR